jgi:hypothetical protein
MAAANCASNWTSAAPNRSFQNRCDRKLPFTFNKRLYKLQWRIEAAFNRLKDLGASQPAMTGSREIIWLQSALLPLS